MSEIAKCRCGAEARVIDDFAVARDPAVPEPAFGPRHTVPAPDGHYEIECLGECGVYVWARTVEEAAARWNRLMRPRPEAPEERPASRTIVECPVCHVLLGVGAGHGVYAACPGCLCVLVIGYGGGAAVTETRVCEVMFSRKYGTERI